MVCGLKNTPELNDEVGMVCGIDESTGRHLVQILPNGGMKAFRRENIVLLQAPGGGIQGADDDDGLADDLGAFFAGVGASSGSASGDAGASGPDSQEDGQWAPGGDDAEMADAFKDCMPLFHDTLWTATACDIELTLSRVVRKVLRDMSVDKSVRRRRAEALLRLGQLLQEPMRERRRAGHRGHGAAGAAAGDDAPEAPSASGGAAAAGAPGSPGPPDATSNRSGGSQSSKKSILARLKPRGVWHGSATKSAAKKKVAEAKCDRMEGALAMMAAGASTDDVDDMIAARATMEREMEGR